MLLSAGLTGAAYLATMSLSAVSMHVGRLVAFGTSGRVDPQDLVTAAVLAGCITVGNAGGRWLRGRAGDTLIGHLEVGTAASLVVLALAGLARAASP